MSVIYSLAMYSLLAAIYYFLKCLCEQRIVQLIVQHSQVHFVLTVIGIASCRLAKHVYCFPIVIVFKFITWTTPIVIPCSQFLHFSGISVRVSIVCKPLGVTSSLVDCPFFCSTHNFSWELTLILTAFILWGDHQLWGTRLTECGAVRSLWKSEEYDSISR